MPVWTFEFDHFWGVIRPVRDGEPVYGTDTNTEVDLREWLGVFLPPEKVEELIKTIPQAWWVECAQRKEKR